MKMCKLTNGSTVLMPVVLTTMMAINSLKSRQDINSKLVIYELGMKAQDNTHKILDAAIEKCLQTMSLLDERGGMHDAVRDITQSAISFDDSETPIIGNPVVGVLDYS